jgi:LPXTG-site transpeptidase (sortase) family protein
VNAEAALPRTRPAPRPRRPISALILKWFGIACLMIAAVLGGYIGWLLWGTGLTTSAYQHQQKPAFVKIVNSKPISQAPAPGTAQALRGSAYAELIIPRIDLDFIVVQGTDEESLKKGPGHYPETADPWDPTGRVGIAGHRTTYLAPFYSLESVQTGDPITLRTEYGTFDYIVTNVYVIPEPGSGVVLTQTKEPTLVLTTCNPRYSSTERLIVTADRV